MSKQHLHPITILVKLFQMIKQSIAIFGFIVVLNITKLTWNPADPRFKWTLLVLLIAFVLLAFMIVYIVLWWRKFTYWTENDELHVQEGIFIKKHQYVPFERIQSMNFKEGIFHRPFQLVKVSIETAGSEDAGIDLLAISREQADWLDAATKRAKRATKQQETPEETLLEEVPQRETIYRMTTKNLFILATTSGGLGVIIAAVGSVMSQLSDIIPYERIFHELQDVAKVGVLLVSLIVLAILFVSWIISIAWTYLNHANFIVEREGDRLFISKGVLEKKRVAVPLARIQGIKIVETPFRQLFGFAAIQLESAGNTENDQTSTISLVPLIKKRDAYDVLAQLFPSYTFELPLTRAPKKAMWRYMLWTPAFALLPVAAACYFIPYGYGYYSLIILLLGAIVGFMQYRTAGFAIHHFQLTIVTRGFSKQTFFVMKNRIQTIKVAQSIFAETGQLARISVSIVAGRAESQTTLRFFEKSALMRIFAWFQPHEKRG